MIRLLVLLEMGSHMQRDGGYLRLLTSPKGTMTMMVLRLQKDQLGQCQNGKRLPKSLRSTPPQTATRKMTVTVDVRLDHYGRRKLLRIFRTNNWMKILVASSTVNKRPLAPNHQHQPLCIKTRSWMIPRMKMRLMSLY